MILDKSESDCGIAASETDALIARSENLRRAGKYDDAMAVLREAREFSPDSLVVRSAQALIQLERGKSDLAREILEDVLATFIPPEETGLDSGPIEPETKEFVVGETIEEVIEEVEAEVAVPFSADSPYANSTMASLLEKQGYVDQASALRDEIAARPEGPETNLRRKDEVKQSVIAQLERWLNHLQRGAQL